MCKVNSISNLPFCFCFHQAFIHLLAVLLGACQFSYFALYGVMVVEHTPSHLTGTAHGIAALFANRKLWL